VANFIAMATGGQS